MTLFRTCFQHIIFIYVSLSFNTKCIRKLSSVLWAPMGLMFLHRCGIKLCKRKPQEKNDNNRIPDDNQSQETGFTNRAVSLTTQDENGYTHPNSDYGYTLPINQSYSIQSPTRSDASTVSMATDNQSEYVHMGSQSQGYEYILD